ncbi:MULTISPECIES: transporter substrate-binding domain-containing protein [unclassified Psychrosphaera]|uniref:transporter substrate-binding domain-containing protein n=1 Tax=unclassified Psychrosphaera TaxID=2641570 RepID=UPI002091A264|nr:MULTISPECIES: transporter substrate-binding domain-containing protein [unclassified Psychrosphaera]
MPSRFIKTTILSIIWLTSAVAYGSPVKLQSYSGDTSLPHKILVETLKRANLEYIYPYASDKDVSNARILNDVKTGSLDVMWSMTSRQLEDDYQALYFPLFRGMLGMRLAIVKAQNKHLFAGVKTLSDLKAFSAGQGKTWPDTRILEHNGLTVAKTLKYPNLFYMLEGERFDYFPRGINEPWDEIVRHKELDLIVEPHIMVRYRAPLYFFLRKDNVALQQTMITTLNNMVADGTFEQMFLADTQVKAALSKANVAGRIIIDLENPLLTERTPINRKELWFDPISYTGN